MMKIDDKTVPVRIIEVWKEAIGRLSDSDLRALATKQGLNAGFRPNKVDLTVARSRVRAALDKMSDLPQDYGAKLRSVTLSATLLRFLSETSVLAHAMLLAQCFGQGRTLAAMLLDERETIRAKGFDLLEAWDGEEPETALRQTASQELLTTFKPFLKHLEQLLTEFEQSPSAVQTAHPSRLPEKATRQQVERHHLVTALRDKRKEANQLRRDLGTVRDERERLSGEALRKDRALADEQARNANLTREHNDLQGHFDTRVDERVSALLDERLQPWLRPAEALTDAVASARDSGLLDRATLLLRQQAEVDKRYGLRSTLQAELKHCQSILAMTRNARMESLNPMSALAPMERELESRVAELQSLLGSTSAADNADNPMIAQLAMTLGTARSLDAVASMRRALQGVESLGLMSDHDLQRAYALVQDATSRMYGRNETGRSPDAARSDLIELPLYALQAQLALDSECTLIVDGHNVLFALPTLFRTLFENGQPGPKARNALANRLVILGQRHPRLTIQLWFDGPVQEERTASDNVRVHFSGGSGSDRADRQIIAYLCHLQNASPHQIRAVVTADEAEAVDAERTGAMVMTPQELAIWLD